MSGIFQATKTQDLQGLLSLQANPMDPQEEADLRHAPGAFGQTSRGTGVFKREGFLGKQPVKGGGFATEFSIGVPVGGLQTEIPVLVPTLTMEELNILLTDIVPNRKPIPEPILRKAFDHAVSRILQGRSPFFEPEDRR